MSLRLFLIILICSAAFSRAESLTLADATRVGLRDNPTIKFARARWDAMTARVPQAAAWEDVRAGVRTRVARFVDVPAESFTDQTLSVEQTIPLSGKNLSRSRIATAEALAAWEDVRRRELDVTAKVRTSFFQLATAHALLDLNRGNATALDQALGIARVRLSVAGQSQAPVLAAENELAKLHETRRDLERGVSDAETQLKLAMNRDAFAPLDLATFDAAPHSSPPLPELRAALLAHRPELRVAQAAIGAAQARVELARREWIPDPTVSVEAQRYNASSQAASEVVAGVSFNLPWLNGKKYRAEIHEAEQELAAAQYAQEAAQNEALGLLRDQLAKLETLHHHAELFRTHLLPNAHAAVAVNRVSFESDKASFADLIAAIREENQLEAQALGHETDYRVALAELDALVGSTPPAVATANSKSPHHQ